MGYIQTCIDYIEKWPFMVIFLYNLYIFCLDITFLLANMGFALLYHDESSLYVVGTN